MNITFFAYFISSILSAIFSARIYFVKKKNPNDIANHFFLFFFFGFIYFFVRFLAMLFFVNNSEILAISYPISHIFLYLSFIFMLDTALRVSGFYKYSKIIFWLYFSFGFFLLVLNFLMINSPTIDSNFPVIHWGTNKLVGIFHIIYGFSAIVTISYIFILQALKNKLINKKFLIIGLGFVFLLLNAFKNAFHSGVALYFFEFIMIIGISIIAIGLVIKDNSHCLGGKKNCSKIS